MAGTDNPYDWAPGQPPPWLSAFGPPPSLVPPVPTVAEAPPRLTPEEEAQIEIDQPPAKAQPEPTAAPVEPAPTAAPPIAQPQPAPSFLPPWLAAQQPQPQPAPAGETLPVDAVSGGAPAAQSQGESPQDTLARITLDPNAPVEQRQQAFAGLAPEERTRIVNSADPSQLATIATSAMDPAELATIMVRHQQAQLHMQTAAQLDAARKTEEEARRNWETWQRVQQEAAAKTAQLTAEADAIAKEKIDPNEHGVGHFIASVLTSAVGGAMSQYTGGRNLALEELDKHTAARIDAQKADIENRWKGATFKRNLIAEHLQQSGDLYRSQETYRIAQYDRALQELQTKAQDYDPQGTTALRITSTMQQLQAQKLAAQQAFNKQQIEDGLKAAQTAQALASAEKTLQETAGLKAKQAGLGAGGAAKTAKPGDVVYPPEHFAQIYGNALPPEMMPKAPISENQFQKQLETTGKGREAATKIEARKITGVMPDGSDFIATAGDDPTVGKVRDQVSASKSLVRLFDDARRIRTGWTSDTAKSKEWQELKTIWASAKGKGKNALGLGAMSDSDFKFLGEYLGTDDPTKAHGVEHAVLKARQLVISDANDALHSVGYKGKFDIKDLQARGPVKSTEDEQLAFVLRGQSGYSRGEATSGGFKATPEQINLVNVWGGALAAAKDDAAREHYAEYLGKVAAGAQAKELRDVARQALLRASAPAASPEQVGPETSIAHETVPPEAP